MNYAAFNADAPSVRVCATEIPEHTRIRIGFTLSGPPVPVPFSKTLCSPTHAEVLIDLDDNGQPELYRVKVIGFRTKKDGTPGRQPAVADYLLRAASYRDDVPQWLRIAVLNRAMARVEGWTQR